MEDLSLEKEFNIYAIMHKQSILTARLADYYRTLDQGVNIPCFLMPTPLERAGKCVMDIFENDRQEFEKLYNKAWEDVAELLP